MKVSRTLVAFIIMFLLTGCGSNDNPVVSSSDDDVNGSSVHVDQTDENSEADEHSLWGYYRLVVDQETMEITAVPDRDVMNHYNVANLLNPPNCNDCLLLNITYHDPVLKIISVEVSMKNPTGLTGYHVRGIVLPQVPGITVINADAYTSYLNYNSAYTSNPYMDIGDTYNYYSILPGETWSRTYDISYDSMSALSNISYAVHVAFPDHCEEPYNILSFPWTLEGRAFETVSVFVSDYQNNVDYVRLYPYPLSGASESYYLNMSSSDGATWEVPFGNTNGMGVGYYNLWVEARSFNSNISLWYSLEVYADSPPPLIPVNVRFYVAKDFDGSFPYQDTPSGPIPFNPDGSVIGNMKYNADIVWNAYGIELIFDGNYYIMDGTWPYDAKFYHLDDLAEATEMHNRYGSWECPDCLCMYYVQSGPPGYHTAWAQWDTASLADHNTHNVKIVYTPTVWDWPEVMAHEGGHGFGALVDIYNLDIPQGYDCIDLYNDSLPGLQYLYCDELAYYYGNLMNFHYDALDIYGYSLTTGQQDWVQWFHTNFPNNF